MPDTIEKFGQRIGGLETSKEVHEFRIKRLEVWVAEIDKLVRRLEVRVAVVVAGIMGIFKVLDRFV